MGSVIKSLKKLYKKMGGTNTKGVNTVDGMVDKIAEKYEAGGSGGSSIFPLTVTRTLGSSDGATKSESLDKTYGEILTALKNDMMPVIVSEINKDDNGAVVYENNNIFTIVTSVNIDIGVDILNDDDLLIKYFPMLHAGHYSFENQDGFESVELALSAYPVFSGIGSVWTLPISDGPSETH